jgi:hypothetical protein
MEKLSPRSYVTGGFDIIKPSLIEFIGRILRKNNKSWWNDNIYKKLRNDNNNMQATGNISDLYNILDELLCFKVILFNDKIFFSELKNNGIILIKKLYEIRNNWAHAPAQGMNENDADDAFYIMIELMEIVDSNLIVRLYSLKDQMHKYYYNDRTIITSKEILVNYINDRVLIPAINDKRESDFVKEAKRKACHTQEYLNKMNTANEIVNFFWDNIINNPRGLDSHKVFKECGLTTFEDIRTEFNLLCYGE